MLTANQQPKDAVECLKRAVMAEPLNPAVLTRLARALHDLGIMGAAREMYERALRVDPTRKTALLGFGQWYEDQGDAEGAAACYRRLLNEEPTHSEALAAIVGLSRNIDVSAELQAASEAMGSCDDQAKALIGYSLGKALDLSGDYDRAFATLAEANASRIRQAGKFDRDAFNQRIDAMISLFSAEFVQERKPWGNPCDRPVFIVGLPRSGTTLTEQIAASHPSCFGAGELPDLTDLATGTPDRLSNNEVSWPECAKMLKKPHIAAIGSDYIARIKQLARDNDVRVIDKQPLNFWHLGLVAIALPKARVIHCTRDIRDNAFSIFSQNFNPDQRWATDLSDIAHYWAGYRRLMAHWEQVTGLETLKAVYEDTVADLEGQARCLMAFLGLPWDDCVLSYHDHDRAVQTPSRWQVRQPLYTSSKEKWRRYERHLGPLLTAIGGG